MGKSKKKVMHSRKEEEQAKKVLLIIGVSALILGCAPVRSVLREITNRCRKK